MWGCGLFTQMCEALCVVAVIGHSESLVVRSERSPPLYRHLSLWSDYGNLCVHFLNFIILRVNFALQYRAVQ